MPNECENCGIPLRGALAHGPSCGCFDPTGYFDAGKEGSEEECDG